MSIAQGLYERGLITYMRTDSTTLSAQAVSAARAADHAASTATTTSPSEPREYRSKVKNAQEAHEAIRPAGEQMRTADDVERRAAFERRAPPLRPHLEAHGRVADGRRPHPPRHRAASAPRRPRARTSRSRRAVARSSSPGTCAPTSRAPTTPRPSSKTARRCSRRSQEQQTVRCAELRPAGHTTQPPARFTEASLVKELEERGIGRPSTYVSVIETILARDYVFKKGTALVPTWKAFAKVQLLERHFAHLIDYDFTATMEEALDAVARGEGEAEKWLDGFYFGNGQAGLRELVVRRTARADRHGRGQLGARRRRRAGQRAHRAGAGPTARGSSAATRRRRSRRPRARRAHAREGRGAARQGRWRSPRPRRRSHDRSHRARAQRPLRSVRAARRAGAGLEGQAAARVAVRVDGARHGHARGGAAAALAPARRRRRHRRRGDHRAERALRALHQEGHRQPQPRRRGAALLGDARPRRRRSSPSPSNDAVGWRSRRIADLGPHPESGAPVRVLDGRFGPVHHRRHHQRHRAAGIQPESVTIDGSGRPARRTRGAWPRRRKKTTAKKSTAKKTPAKKSTAKKATAKKTTAKKAPAKRATRKATTPPAPGPAPGS